MRVYTSGQIESGADGGVFAPSGFTGVVEEMLCDYPSRDAIRCYVAEVYRIAAAVLGADGDCAPDGCGVGEGAAGRSLPPEITRGPARNGDDPALRLIEGLFERGPHGGFVRLRSFYLANDWQRLSDEELWVLTRRLVEGWLSTDVESIPELSFPKAFALRARRSAPVDDCSSLKNRLVVDLEAFG